MRAVSRAAYTYGRWNRRRKLEFADGLARRLGVRTVLLVGVNATSSGVNNVVERGFLERGYALTASGVEIADGQVSWERYVVADGRCLPFGDQTFDLTYANAVIEHVGGDAQQQHFVDEITRVGRSAILTTPNRFFPLEAHYHTLASHWRDGWSRGTVTRLLGIRDLRALSPPGARVIGRPLVSPTLTMVCGPAAELRGHLRDGG